MKEVIVYFDDSQFVNAAAFTNEQKCLDFFRERFPKKKNLRLKRSTYYPIYTLLNHTTPVLDFYEKIRAIKLDPTFLETC